MVLIHFHSACCSRAGAGCWRGPGQYSYQVFSDRFQGAKENSLICAIFPSGRGLTVAIIVLQEAAGAKNCHLSSKTTKALNYVSNNIIFHRNAVEGLINCCFSCFLSLILEFLRGILSCSHTSTATFKLMHLYLYIWSFKVDPLHQNI